MVGYQHLSLHHAITLPIVPSETGTVSSGWRAYLGALSTKVDKLWLGEPPEPKMTSNDLIIIKNDRSATPIWYVMKIDQFYHVIIGRKIVRPKKRQLQCPIS